MLRVVFAALLIGLFSGVVYAEIELGSYLTTHSIELQWDPLRDLGILWSDLNSITFRPNSPYYTVNFDQIVYLDPPLEKENRIYLSDETVAFFNTYFGTSNDGISNQGFSFVKAIFIDPGHGGQDPGASGRLSDGRVLNEKDIVLSVGLILQEMLRFRFPDKAVYISRNTDTYVSLEERTELANDIELGNGESMLFISIHVNASLNKEAQGFEVWYLPPEIERDNLVPEQILFDLEEDTAGILSRLKDEEVSIESVLFAQNILNHMDTRIGHISKNRGLREEAWYVVRNTKMPAILVELGFISHSQERFNLNNPDYQKILAEALYSGIESYVINIEGLP